MDGFKGGRESERNNGWRWFTQDWEIEFQNSFNVSDFYLLNI